MVSLLTHLLSGADQLGSESGSVTECCSICLDPLENEHETSLSGCGHAFHSRCIVVALQHNRSCPLCRYAPDLQTEESEHETSPPVSPAAADRRRRGIRSTLMRVRHGSASDTAVWASGQYRSLGDRLQLSRTAYRSVDRELSSERRCMRNDIEKVIRRRKRQIAPLYRRWWQRRIEMERVESERQQVGDLLASEALLSPSTGSVPDILN